MVKVAVLYVGSSLLSPLRRAERDIESQYHLGLRILAHNCTLPLSDAQWTLASRDIAAADVVFVIHVTDSENGARIAAALDQYGLRHHAVVVINCMGDLMRRTRLGKLDFAPAAEVSNETQANAARRLARQAGAWMAGYARGKRRPDEYLSLVAKLPRLLRFVPSTGKLADIKNYLSMFCYFLQPTPANIRSMILYAVKHYVPGCAVDIETPRPETRPTTGIYHPDAPSLFTTVDEYRGWYEGHRRLALDPERTIGLLLMRTQIVSGASHHYDGLIHALEDEGVPALPVLSTFMDNRVAAGQFFIDPATGRPNVSQMLSLTGFSFVGGPAMNDSKAAVDFLRKVNRPLRSAVSLEVQKVEDWAESGIGLNPVQTAMQVAIPEIDGATEPFVFGGLPAAKDQPEPIEDRCRRIARRLARWNRLRRLPNPETRLAFVIYCFPPNKGNLGTAADLEVFESLCEILRRLESEGYAIKAPESAIALREMIAGPGGALAGDDVAEVAYRLDVDEYYRLCPYVEEIEAEWGPAPGRINAQGRHTLIHGIELGNAGIFVQPGFGYEGDPMRMLMAKGCAPHHAFMGLYVYLEKIFRADAVVHVGTHGALEFMPGKQVGLSESCWPDRLMGELPNIYIYSVNNPSEGSIARRRSSAALVSYLTPPIENAGLYKELVSLKELLDSYRQSTEEGRKDALIEAIQEKARVLNLL